MLETKDFSKKLFKILIMAQYVWQYWKIVKEMMADKTDGKLKPLSASVALIQKPVN